MTEFAIIIGLLAIIVVAGLLLTGMAQEFPFPDECWDCRRTTCAGCAVQLPPLPEEED